MAWNLFHEGWTLPPGIPRGTPLACLDFSSEERPAGNIRREASAMALRSRNANFCASSSCGRCYSLVGHSAMLCGYDGQYQCHREPCDPYHAVYVAIAFDVIFGK